MLVTHMLHERQWARGRASMAAAPKMDAKSESGEEGLICVMRLWKADSQRETTADEGRREAEDK